MTVIGSASINIRADDKYFEPDVRRAVAKIKDLRVALKVDADMSAANKKLRDLRYRMSQNEVQIKIRANDVGFEADVRAAVRKIKNVTIDLKADVDSSKASKKIRDLRYRITSKDAILTVDANMAKAEEKMRKFLEKFINTDVNIHAKAHTGAANTALSELQTRYGGTVNFTAKANTALARAALAHAARTRHAKILASVDPSTLSAIKGAFNTITGTLPFEKIQKAIAGVVGNFEGLAVKVGAVSTALLSLGGAALTAGANIFSIGGDITQVVGIAAMLPAVFASMISIVVANKMAWKDFGTAVKETGEKGAEALAKLPPNAQNAALALRGVYTEIQKPVQNAFWDQMDDAIGDMIDSVLPSLIGGLSKVGGALGGITKSVVEAFGRLGDGTLERMFDNLSTGLGNMTEGTGAFIDALNILGDVGATYLPALGTALNDSALKFRDWISTAQEGGRINDWIDTSVRRFQELGSVVKSTTNIMSGLTEIARLSGAPGLTEMAAGFRNVADVVNSEPFQSQLLSILEGARAGTEALGKGLGTLTELFWNSSASVSAFLEVAGQIAGLTFENITALFDGTGLGSGLFSALMGLKEAMGDLGPGFRDMGIAFGDLGRVAGELFRNMAPSLNMLAETIKGVIGGLSDGIIDAMPVFNEFAQAVLNLASGPLIALAEGVGNMLTTFSELPGVVQTVMMSLGLFLLLKPKFEKFFGGMAASLAKEDSVIGNTFRNMRTNAADTFAMLRQDAGRVGTSLTSAFRLGAQGGIANMGLLRAGVVGHLSGISGVLKEFGSGIKSALVVDSEMGSVKRGFSGLGDSARNAGGAISNAFYKASVDTGAHMANLGDKAGNAFRGIGSRIAPETNAISNAFYKASVDTGAHLGNIRDKASNAFKGFAGFVAPAGKAIGDMGTKARTMAGAMSGNLAPARAAFSQLATHATTMGKTAAAGMTSGIKAGAGGLAGVLGGPWGIALMGATVALGAYAQKAAESKARVEELTGALQSQGGAWSGVSEDMLAANMLDGATGAWDDFYRGVIWQSQSVEESFTQLGISAKDVSTELADSAGRDKYLEGWDKIQGAMRDGKPITEEMAAAIGSTSEAFKGMSANDLGHLMREIEGVAEEAEKAEARAKALGETFGTSTIESQRLASNYEVLENATSSVSEKFSALKSNMDILNGGTMSAAEASKSYHQSLSDTAKAIEQVREANGGVVNNLYDTVSGFDMASQSGRDLHTALSGSADAILMTATQAFQTARQGGKSMEEAQEIAVNAMNAPLQSFRQSLEALGFAPAQIDGIVASFGLIPEEVRTALYADGDQAVQEAFRTELMIKAFADGNYEAVLGALPADAKAGIGEALGLADEFAAGDYEAILDVLDKTPGGMEAALAALGSFDGTDWEAFLIANNLVPEEVQKANEAAQGLIGEKSIDLVAQDLASGVMGTVEAYDFNGKSINLTAEDNISSMLSAINGSPLADKQNQLTTVDLVTEMVNELNAKELNGKLTELQAQDLVTLTMDEINAKSLDGKTADFNANDLASMVLLGINNTTLGNKEMQVVADDLATGVMGTVNAYNVDDRLVHLTANDLVSDVLAGVNASPLMDKGSELTTTDLVSQIVTDVNNKQLNGKMNKLETQDLVSAVLATVNAKGLNDKGSKLTTADLVSFVVDGVNGKSMWDKSNTLSTSDNVSGVISNINAMVLLDKANTVTTTLRTLREGFPQANGGIFSGSGDAVMANGGIMKSAGKSAVQAFADGGVVGGAVKAFAGGGIENHTAQIARGAWPVRIWAEPETGGEAYIPLSPNKRKRSLDILKIVMKEFGVQGFMNGKAFANGGINKAERYTTPKVISSRYAAASTGSVTPAAQPTTQLAAPIINVHPSQGLNEEQIGVIASDQLWFNIQNSSF